MMFLFIDAGWEDLGLKTGMVVVILSLCAVIRILHKEHKTALSNKDKEYLDLVESSNKEIVKTKNEFAEKIQEVLKTLYDNGEISKSMVSEYQKHMPEIIHLLRLKNKQNE